MSESVTISKDDVGVVSASELAGEPLVIENRCAGAVLESEEQVKALLQRMKPPILNEEDYEALIAPDTLRAIGPVIYRGQQYWLVRAPENKLQVRKYCGQRLDELISAIPFDGEVHSIQCPKCGLESTVRRVPEE